MNWLLKSKVLDLKVEKKFTPGYKDLNLVLPNEQGLGYSLVLNEEKDIQTFFCKDNNFTLYTPLYNASSIIFTSCGLMDHLSSSCRMQYRVTFVK